MTVRYPALYEKMNALAEVPAAEWRKLEAIGVERAFDKREFFLRVGEPSDRFGLVVAGLFRVFRVSREGKELTKAFRAEGELIGAYAEILQGIDSRTAIQALEPSVALELRMRDLRALEAGHPSWERLARRIAERHFVYKDQREHEFLHDSAETRYRRFRDAYPSLLPRLAQHEIASFLGITPVALSRILGQCRARAKTRRSRPV